MYSLRIQGKFTTSLLLYIFLGCFLNAHSLAFHFTNIVAFGDSFTDNGNGSFRITNGTWPANPAYYKGRFSNGPVWVEDLAANLSAPLTDYAIGGATTSNKLVQGYTGPNSTVPVPSVDDQVTSWLPTNPGGIHKALFVVFGGANDVFFKPTISATASVNALTEAINRLRGHGAEHFLVLNYYNISRIPFDHYTTPKNKHQLAVYGNELGTALAELAQVNKDIAYADLTPLFADFDYYGNPTSYGFDQCAAYSSCLTGAYGETPTTTLCSNAQSAVFWDEYHPTAAVHRLIAKVALSALVRKF